MTIMHRETITVTEVKNCYRQVQCVIITIQGSASATVSSVGFMHKLNNLPLTVSEWILKISYFGVILLSHFVNFLNP